MQGRGGHGKTRSPTAIANRRIHPDMSSPTPTRAGAYDRGTPIRPNLTRCGATTTIARMPALDSGPVAVTGATGYLASWVVHELLSRGATVHATVRDPGKAARTKYLRDMAEELPGELKLFPGDLLARGSFAAAFEGCTTVLHTASPFIIGKVKDPQRELVDPALEGTRNVLSQVNETPSVRRVVLTSSTVAVYGDTADCAAAGGVLREEHWNTTSTLHHQPYSYSKTVAEREAWKIADAQDRWKLVVINPSFIFGPSLPPSRRDGASIEFLRNTIGGKWRTGTVDVMSGWVDVRDVAFAHAEAAVRDDAEGRHIVCAQCMSFFDAGKLIEAELGARVKPPKRVVPKALAYLMAPLNGFTFAFVSRNVGHPLKLDGSKARDRLGVKYRPVRETLVEHARQLLGD
jgi:nucleoside-diphosphate-sugar epimerase